MQAILRIKMLLLSLVLCAIESVTHAACLESSSSLWERLGGEKVMSGVVDATLNRTASEPLTRRSFDKVNLQKLKIKIVEHLCELSGGPCKYSGDSMTLAHQGLDITEAEFFGMVQQLRDALDSAGVAQDAKNELLRLLAPMKRDIVTK